MTKEQNADTYVDEAHRSMAEAFRDLAEAIEKGGNVRTDDNLRAAFLEIRAGIDALGLEENGHGDARVLS